jgi:hypothetical protein
MSMTLPWLGRPRKQVTYLVTAVAPWERVLAEDDGRSCATDTYRPKVTPQLAAQIGARMNTLA